MLVKQFFDKRRKYGIARAIALTTRWLRVAIDAKLRRHLRGSFSQYGEDLVIDRLLGNPAKGLYVDVGANDPELFSNTKMFYERGWCGVNIEPNATNHARFVKQRPSDMNLNIGVGEFEGSMTFHIFEPDQISTFSTTEPVTRFGSSALAAIPKPGGFTRCKWHEKTPDIHGDIVGLDGVDCQRGGAIS